MYRNPRNRVGRVVNFFSDNFLFQAVLHQGSLHRAVIVIKSNESRMRGYVALHLSFASAFWGFVRQIRSFGKNKEPKGLRVDEEKDDW